MKCGKVVLRQKFYLKLARDDLILKMTPENRNRTSQNQPKATLPSSVATLQETIESDNEPNDNERQYQNMLTAVGYCEISKQLITQPGAPD